MNYEHDLMNLNKEEFLQVLNELVDEWKQNKLDNWKYILWAESNIMMIKHTDEDKLKAFWLRFWDKADELRYRNKLQDKAMPEVLRETYNGGVLKVDFREALNNV